MRDDIFVSTDVSVRADIVVRDDIFVSTDIFVRDDIWPCVLMDFLLPLSTRTETC